jgi:hypothetical protein
MIASKLRTKSLNLNELKKIVKKRKDFFILNDIDFTQFCKGLFTRLTYELSFYVESSFYEAIVIFKRKMENGNFRGFPKTATSEDTLRSALVLYIKQETFCEPRSAAGNNDITIPSEKVVIETKLWNGIEYYKSGFPELYEYLDKYNYSEGYYINFDYNQTENEVIKANGETFDIKCDSKQIHVFFIKMNAVRPSKVYKKHK